MSNLGSYVESPYIFRELNLTRTTCVCLFAQWRALDYKHAQKGRTAQILPHILRQNDCYPNRQGLFWAKSDKSNKNTM